MIASHGRNELAGAIVDMAEVVLMAHTKELAADPETRPLVARAVADLVPFTLPFFGRVRSQVIERSYRFVVEGLGLDYPQVAVTWVE